MAAHYKKHSINNIDDHIGVIGAVNGNLVEFNSDGLFADSGASISDFSVTGHTHVAANITDFDAEVSNNVDVAANTSARHSHANKALLDTYTQTDVDIADAISKEHTHANKALLDTYTQAEVDLADAVAKKHNTHAAADVSASTTNFNNILSVADDTVQKALDTLDNFSVSATTWGTITGTLSSQTDLQTALDGKADTVHSHVASDVTDFDVEVSNNTDVAANTSARHDQDSDLYLDFGNANQVSASEIRAFIDSKAQVNGLASLDATGKVPSSQLPSIAITDVNVVANIVARDALTPNEGDVCKVVDAGSGYPETYIYDGSAWIDIQESSDVISVNGDTGVVVLDTDDINEGSVNFYYTEAKVSANVDVAANTVARHTQNTDTQLRSGLVEASAVGELKIKVFRQASQPVLSADDFAAFWVDTSSANQTFFLLRESSSNTVSVELA